MITKEWIGGFISGEGCFTFVGNAPRFCITLSHKDKYLLKKIQELFNVGKVSIAKKDFSYIYQVSKLSDCLIIVKFLEGYIEGDKLIDFENWKLGIKYLSLLPKEEKLKNKNLFRKLQPRINTNRILYTKFSDL